MLPSSGFWETRGWLSHSLNLETGMRLLGRQSTPGAPACSSVLHLQAELYLLSAAEPGYPPWAGHSPGAQPLTEERRQMEGDLGLASVTLCLEKAWHWTQGVRGETLPSLLGELPI